MADLVLTATAIVKTATTKVEYGMFAGEAIIAGEVVYRDPSLGTVFKADADSATAAARTVRGFALNGGGIGQPIAVAYGGSLTIGAVMTKGLVYCLSDVAGKIRPVADNASGDFVSLLGVASSTSVLDININNSGVSV